MVVDAGMVVGTRRAVGAGMVAGTGMAVGDVHSPAKVYGVHGTEGVSYWSCLTRRLGLSADWEAVEWACLPVGGVSGAHLHTRTEELYFILSGTGRISWAGGDRQVGPGDLIATPVGARHGLTNIGDEPLAWLVTEVSAPEQAAALSGVDHRRRDHSYGPHRHGDHSHGDLPGGPAEQQETNGGTTAVSVHIVNLRERQRFDARTVLTGPIRDVRLRELAPGDLAELVADGVEYTAFAVSGRGTAGDGTSEVELSAGVAVTVPMGGKLVVRASGDESLELFTACLAVTGAADEAADKEAGT